MLVKAQCKVTALMASGDVTCAYPNTASAQSTEQTRLPFHLYRTHF